MNPLEGLLYGFSVALTPDNVLAALGGTLAGTVCGVLPGLGPTVVIALLLIPTISLRPETGLIALAAIYYGTQYGNSITAILMNVPSEAPSVVIAMDGYKLTSRGRGGAALAVAAVASFIGASIGLVGLTLFAGVVSGVALSFGPPEYTAITIFGLVVLSRMSSGSMWKGLLAIAVGLVLTTVGMDPLSGVTRFAFGQVQLAQGIDMIPVIVGSIGLAEMFHLATSAGGPPRAKAPKLREMMPTSAEWRESLPASLRGSVIGFFIGLLPGPAITLSPFASYRVERGRMTKHPEQFEHGSFAAVAGPKSADDASVSASLIPLMALGLPFTPVTAVLFAGMTLHGVQPSPFLMQEHPEVFWGLVAAMYVGNVVLLVLNAPLVGLWISILRIPQAPLMAILAILMMIGSFSLRNSMLDMAVVVISGIAGYVMREYRFDRTLIILGLILGPILESNLRKSLFMSQGDLTIFFQRPISLGILIALLLVMVGPIVWRHKLRRWQPALKQMP